METARVGDNNEVDGGDREEEDAQHRLLHRVLEAVFEVGGVREVDHHHGKVDVVS